VAERGRDGEMVMVIEEAEMVEEIEDKNEKRERPMSEVEMMSISYLKTENCEQKTKNVDKETERDEREGWKDVTTCE
jgi:hypothetical protein